VNRSPIGIGDVIRAIAALAPEDPARWPSIAGALGFELPSTGSLSTAAKPASDRETSGATRPRQIVLEEATAQSEATLPLLAPIEPAARGGTPPPFPLNVQDLPAAPPAGAGTPPPGLAPLLPPVTMPSILRATVVVPKERGPLNVKEAVDRVARRRPFERVPRHRSFGVTHDVLVLQDLGAGMDAFIEDVEQLIAALHRVAGETAVRVGGFLGRPAAALEETGLHRGTAVVVLTDLGLTRLAGPDETGTRRWIELADAAARAVARVTLLVPWPSERWPPEVAARLALVTWDRTASVAHVLHAVREHA
jgi:hypothetical protein